MVVNRFHCSILRPQSCWPPTLMMIILVSISLFPLGSSVLTARPQIIVPSLEAFSGVYMQEVPTSSIFYTSVAPLVYGFKVPNWSQKEMVLPIVNCTSNQSSSSRQCPIIFYLGQIQARFLEYLYNNRPLLHRFLEMGATPQMTDVQFECHTLGRHFQDSYVDQGVMQRYLAKLKDCSPAGDAEFIRHLNNFAYNISDVYRKMYQGFNNEIWVQVHDEKIDVGLWSNAQTVLNSLNFLNYQIELNRWHLALGDCEAGRIPASLITPELITDSLQDLFENLQQKSNLLPVISGSDIGNYFKNTLADCTFTNESLIVRILVPVIAKDHSYSFYSIRPATFYDNVRNRFCQLKLSNTIFLLDNLERVAYDTSCNSAEFCHAPSSQSIGKVNPCASALLNDDWEDVLEYCPFSCYSLSKYHKRLTDAQPLSVIQMDATTFLVAGSRSLLGSSLQISLNNCPTGMSTRTNVIEIKEEEGGQVKIGREKGALEIRVQCGCTLTVGVTNYSSSTSYCSDVGPKSPQFKQIVPFNWLRQPKKILSRLNVAEEPSGSVTYFKISFEDLIKIGEERSSDSDQIKSNGNGVPLFLIISCIMITFGFCILVAIVVRKLASLGINLFSKRGSNTLFKIPETITYQNMQQDL